jgi:hypothetical protein
VVRALDALRTLGSFHALVTLRALGALVACDALHPIFAALGAIHAPVFTPILAPVVAGLLYT